MKKITPDFYSDFKSSFKLYSKLLIISGCCLCILLLTGCSAESIADRTYTQAIGLTYDKQEAEFQFYTQQFQEDAESSSVTGVSIAEVLRQEEAVSGGKIFIGHTELLCLDGSCTLYPAEELLFRQGLSPACKIFYTQPETYFADTDSTATVHTIRMAEQTGLLSTTELSTALGEWQGIWETALVPAQAEKQAYPSLVLLRKDGRCTELSDAAAKGMYWLRRNTGNFTLTLETPDKETENTTMHTTTIFIRKCSLKKSVQDNILYYDVKIHSKDSTEDTRKQLEQLAKKQCEAAICEMLQAGADVIHMQEMLEHAGIRAEKDTPPQIRVSVTVC